MKKLLITGAYGLVGSTICKVLDRDYPDIEVTKIKCTDGLIGLPTVNYDYVIFGAGYGQPQMFSKQKIETIQINTDHVTCSFNKIKTDGKFLYVSSSEIYSGAKTPYKETYIGTTTPQHPRACYIEGKRCGEAICMAYKEQGYDVKIARLALGYGPGTKKGDTRVLNQLIEQALTTGRIKLKDKGEAIRTYCYIDDVAEMMLKILFEGKDCVYNVGGDSTVTIEGLAKKIGEITNCTVELGDTKLEGAPDNVRLDMKKTLSEFPMQFTPLGEGLKRTIEYQKQLYA
jgi:nucleoside-diphosphate-sugar epimerase